MSVREPRLPCIRPVILISQRLNDSGVASSTPKLSQERLYSDHGVPAAAKVYPSFSHDCADVGIVC